MKKFHFPVKLYKIRKKRYNTKWFTTKIQFLMKCIFFVSILKNTIKKFHCFIKICEIQKKRLDGKLFT